jgi:hypothetical protein
VLEILFLRKQKWERAIEGRDSQQDYTAGYSVREDEKGECFFFSPERKKKKKTSKI